MCLVSREAASSQLHSPLCRSLSSRSSLSRSDVKRKVQQKKDEGEDRGHVGSFDNTVEFKGLSPSNVTSTSAEI